MLEPVLFRILDEIWLIFEQAIYIMKRVFLLLGFLTVVLFGFAQEENNLVQFSGLVLTGDNDRLEPIPYATLQVENTTRGTNSDIEGFFSIVARKGETITFTAIGFRPQTFTIPDSLVDKRYSVVQLLTRDTFNLPEIVIFPWPSKDHFAIEFLAMEDSDQLPDYAAENLAQEKMEAIRKKMAYDGNESADYTLRQSAQKYYYYGQAPPMNIFNPLAWAEFFKAWKDGKYKIK